MSQYREIHYTDELLSDRSVHRRFADGREEWRRRAGDHYVQWQDNAGRSGIDEVLGDRIIKRRYTTGQVVYGRDQGYGRTAWGDGTMTVNRTSFGGRTGAILAAVGAGALLGAIVAPPLLMSEFEEDELRRQASSNSSRPATVATAVTAVTAAAAGTTPTTAAAPTTTSAEPDRILEVSTCHASPRCRAAVRR
ncbi:hypothetical protein [Dactylosporangium cerinum]